MVAYGATLAEHWTHTGGAVKKLSSMGESLLSWPSGSTTTWSIRCSGLVVIRKHNCATAMSPIEPISAIQLATTTRNGCFSSNSMRHKRVLAKVVENIADSSCDLASFWQYKVLICPLPSVTALASSPSPELLSRPGSAKLFRRWLQRFRGTLSMLLEKRMWGILHSRNCSRGKWNTHGTCSSIHACSKTDTSVTRSRWRDLQQNYIKTLRPALVSAIISCLLQHLQQQLMINRLDKPQAILLSGETIAAN